MFGQPPDVTVSAGGDSDGGSDGTGQEVSGESEIRIVEMEVPLSPDDELGFKLTKTLWDPYPWVREVNPTGRAARAGLKLADCILQADSENVIGLSVSRVASIIRSSRGRVKLRVWNCGTNPSDDPESLFTPGGAVRGERARAALRGVLAALACGACGATSAPRARRCRRGHLLCAACRPRLDRCPLCRDLLPAAGAPDADCLLAKQVFDAIASVYGLETGAAAPRSAVPQHLLRPQLSKSLTNLTAGRYAAAPAMNNSLENVRIATLAGSCQSLNACSNHLCLDSTPVYVLTPMTLMRCEQTKQ